jgi:hypothetical protein
VNPGLLPAGSILQDRYQIIRLLGQGGMGAVSTTVHRMSQPIHPSQGDDHHSIVAACPHSRLGAHAPPAHSGKLLAVREEPHVLH